MSAAYNYHAPTTSTEGIAEQDIETPLILQPELKAIAKLEPDRQASAVRAVTNLVRQHTTASFAGEPSPISDAPGSYEAHVFSARDLLAEELPPPRWAVQGLICEGLNLIASPPKFGKSWFALQLVLAISAGGVALSHIPVEQGDSLYIALEDSKRRLQDRIRLLLSREPNPDYVPHGLDLATSWPTMDAGGLDKLKGWLDDHQKARLVVIDTLARIRPRGRGRGGSAYDEEYAETAQLQSLAMERGIALLVLHHTRKMDADDPYETVSGTFGVTAAIDSGMVLTRERGTHDAALYVRGRDIEEQQYALRWDKEWAGWDIIGTADDYRMSEERQEIRDAVRNYGGPVGPTEIAKLLPQRKPNAIRKMMYLMSRDGELLVGSRGKYTAPDPSLLVINRGSVSDEC